MVEKNLSKLNKKAVELLKKTPTNLLEFANGKSLKSTKTKLQDSTVENNKKNVDQVALTNQKAKANLLSKYVFNKFFICCKESRIESPNSFYGCFYIGPFDESLSQTLAHNIRRTLLSQLSGFAITAVEIDGVLHKFSNLPGIKETVLDIICNLQNLVFKESIKPTFALALKPNSSITLQQLEFTAYLRVRGPGIVTAADIILPSGLQCVNPNQYIATLAEDGSLNMKLYISSGQGQNYIKQKQKNMDLNDIKQNFLVEAYTGGAGNTNSGSSATISSVDQNGENNYLLTNIKKNKIYLDSVFMPVTKVNTIVQANDKCTDDLLENNLEFKFIPNATQGLGVKQSFKAVESKVANLKDKNLNHDLLTSADFDTSFSTSCFNLAQKDVQNQVSFKVDDPKNANTKINTFFTTNNPLLAELSNSSNKSATQTLSNANKNLDKEGLQASNQVLSSEYLKEQVIVLTSQQPNKMAGSPINQKKQCHIVVEIWTNGSIHPRKALKNCLEFLSNTFVTLENIKMLGSMFKSDVTYAKLLKKNK